MLTRFPLLSTRHARAVVLAAVIVLAVAMALGGGVADHLTSGGFEDPASESERADEILAERFDTAVPNLLLLVTAPGGDVDDPAVAGAGQQLADELAAEDNVADVVSYWSEGNVPPLRNEDRSRALVVGRIEGNDDEVEDRLAELGPRYEGEDAGGVIDVQVGGFAQVFREVGATIEEDLVRAEIIALPITLVLLIVVFGSGVAASLPVVIGLMSIVGTFFLLRVLAALTDVSIYALNLTTALGLGLAIDYSLFIVSRYREELRAGHAPRVAATLTVHTAGRTVAFSALTVAASLCAMLVFPTAFLRSMAYAGAGVALLAGLFAVVALPAILVLLGHRVNALTLWRRSVSPPGEGFWHRVAMLVMRRPIPIATAVIAVLLVLGAPFLGLNLTSPDNRVLPESAGVRQVHDVIRGEFSSEEQGALSVVAPEVPAAGRRFDNQIDAYARELAALPGVARVDAASGTYCGGGSGAELGCETSQLLLPPDSSPRYRAFLTEGATYLSVVPSVEPLSAAGERLVHDIRDTDAPWDVLVTGQSADLVDSKQSLFERLPWALGLVALITAVLLFMMFGSVVIPAKAIVINVLSLTATFGAMVWVFQDGHLAGLLDFTATGGLDADLPILMFCVAFGLSMDYEVMLLSRIKEEHDRGSDSVHAVAVGLECSGRIITAAAVLIAVVMIAFATSQVSFIKLFGVGLTLAVLTDAFLIRGTLVPAFMRLAGEWNWWAPRPLRRFHDRWGIGEHVDLHGQAPSAPELNAEDVSTTQ